MPKRCEGGCGKFVPRDNYFCGSCGDGQYEAYCALYALDHGGELPPSHSDEMREIREAMEGCALTEDECDALGIPFPIPNI